MKCDMSIGNILLELYASIAIILLVTQPLFDPSIYEFHGMQLGVREPCTQTITKRYLKQCCIP